MNTRLNREVKINAVDISLPGNLVIPAGAKAIVIFSHGSGSSRFSKRNLEVAGYLQENNIGTLLLDLLTEEEDKFYDNRFDIELLTKRLAGATAWLEEFPSAKDCRIGYFGASTGAASALRASAIMPSVQAIVSRGGRPDLAVEELSCVNAPTLFIVGSLDHQVLQLNKEALEQLDCVKRLEIIEGATHLFEEPGKMKIVAALAAKWFTRYLVAAPV